MEGTTATVTLLSATQLPSGLLLLKYTDTDVYMQIVGKRVMFHWMN